MSRTITWNNLDQREKEVWLDQLGKEGGEASEYLAITGGTLTGALTTPGLTSTAAITASAGFNGRTMAMTSTASILGTLNVGGTITTGGTVVDAGVLNIHTMAMTSTASILGTLNVVGAVTTSGAISGGAAIAGRTFAMTSTASILGAANIGGAITGIGGAVLNSADVTNTLLLQHTTLAGASYAPLKIVASTASQAFFHLSGAVLSTASLVITAANCAGVVLVRFDGQGGAGIGYLPIFKYI